MQIRDTFATKIGERIEPVVKVAERRPAIVLNELANLVVTPQWERYLHHILDAYSDAADRTAESGIGVWISGFFGSGKSLLLKTLGTLLEGGTLEGQSVHATFLDRLPASSSDRADLERFLKICERKISTTAVGGNLHAVLARSDDPLVLIAFKLFAQAQGYSDNAALAWAVEHPIAERGRSADFRQRAGELAGMEWAEIAHDAEFYMEQLQQAAADTLPDHFSGPAAVERAVAGAAQNGISAQTLITRLRSWCEARDAAGRRHKLLLQLDELGQWLGGGNAHDRTMQVQALVETAAANGGGRIWLAVTAHGDVQALRENVQQEYYAKITQRFALQCKLSNDDISRVVEERLLRKTQRAREELRDLFQARPGDLADLGTLGEAARTYPPPDAQTFPLFYPYLPWTVAIIPDVVKGIAQAAGREEALTGSNRTMIGVVQGAILETPGLLDSPVGRLLSLADLYDQLASDVPIETKTDLNTIAAQVPGATPFTTRVAQGLFLLGQAQYIGTTVDNVARALVDGLDTNLATLRKAVRSELDRLVAAGYAKLVGEQYLFLTTQQRSFQDRVRARQDELLTQSYALSQALKEYESEDALRFDRVPLHGREVALRLELDGKVLRNPGAAVALRVYSPLQRALDPDIADDTLLKGRANAEPNSILLRLEDVPELRRRLALAVATAEVAAGVTQTGGPEAEVARTAKTVDLVSHKADVRRYLAQAVRGGTLFFRGTLYNLTAGDSPALMVRGTLASLLPSIYPRAADVTHRVANEEAAVKAALAGNTNNSDLQQLGVYKTDGSLNEAHALLSELRGRLPLTDSGQAPVLADDLRSLLERPPYGWDANAVKVGLALLLRAAACVLIDSSQRLTDPSAPDTLAALTKEQRFKGLRVEGVKTDLSMTELQQIRGYISTMFDVKPSLVAATLNNSLGDQLQEVARQARALQGWAATAQCPLPYAFESGSSLVEELLNTGAAPVRLRRFLEQATPLVDYTTLLRELREFQHAHGAQYSALRDFFNTVVNLDSDLSEVRRFLSDWRTLDSKRTVTEPARWDELVPVYHAAQQALTDQAHRWLGETRAQLETLDSSLAAKVQATGVPDEKLADELAGVRAGFADVRRRLTTDAPTYAQGRSTRQALAAAEQNLPAVLAEMRVRYKPIIGPPPGVKETRLRWAEFGTPAHIGSPADLVALLIEIRKRVEAELGEGHTVIIE